MMTRNVELFVIISHSHISFFTKYMFMSFVHFQSALLKYTLHVKSTNSLYNLIFTKVHSTINHTTNMIQNIFLYYNKFVHAPFAVNSLPPTSISSKLYYTITTFLSFLEFHINRIIQLWFLVSGFVLLICFWGSFMLLCTLFIPFYCRVVMSLYG